MFCEYTQIILIWSRAHLRLSC